MLEKIQEGWQQPGWINRILYPLSLLYAAMMAVRRGCYGAGLLWSHALPVPVVVVGNLSVGGTGKTPLVIALVAALAEKGYRPGVISRGYGGNSSFWPRQVTPDDSASEVGDEPLMIARQCEVPVVAGPARVRSARLLVDKLGCDVIVSDDGFQHLALRRDVDIVVLDGERRLGNRWCLPAGPLREPPSALARADLIVVNGQAREGEYAFSGAVSRALQIGGDQVLPLDTWRGRTVHVVAAIGNPDRLLAQLEQKGIDVVPHLFPDHHAFAAGDLEFARESHDITVFMTDKDAVKCEHLCAGGQFWRVPLEVTLDPGLVPAVIDRI